MKTLTVGELIKKLKKYKKTERVNCGFSSISGRLRWVVDAKRYGRAIEIAFNSESEDD